jgi:hypothetical protein
VVTAWWAARRRDSETRIFDCAGLIVAFSAGAALVISGLEAAYGNTGLKHDFPVAPYFVFGSLLLGTFACLGMEEFPGPDRAPSLADVHCLFHRCRFVLLGTAKSNARVHSRIEAAIRAASPDTNFVDLLAVPRVVRKDLQTRSDCRQAGASLS